MQKKQNTPPKVGTVIHRARKAHGWTLEELAKRSGVSRSMLSQIERDLTNPTFATVWRITSALGLGLEGVLPSPQSIREMSLLPDHATPALGSADRKCTLRILGPMELAAYVEWYDFQAAKGGALISEPHEAGTTEHLTVLDGKFQVQSGEQVATVAAGETIRYRGDLPHAIRNLRDAPSRGLIVVTHAPAQNPR